MLYKGHRCGYVGVPLDSPLYGVSYDSHCEALNQKHIDILTDSTYVKEERINFVQTICWDGKKSSPSIFIDVHGGITYSDNSDTYPTDTPQWIHTGRSNSFIASPYWWFGFDCAHLHDAKDAEIVRRHNSKVSASALFSFNHGIVRSHEYCVNECQHMARQLAAI